MTLLYTVNMSLQVGNMHHLFVRVWFHSEMRVLFSSVVAMVTRRWTLLFENHTFFYFLFCRLNLQKAFLFLTLFSAPF